VDSASACTAKTAQRLLAEFQRLLAEFQRLLAEYHILVDWPPYSPDLNLLDFSISCVLQVKVQTTAHSNLDALRKSITAEWDQLAAAYICKTCHSFRRCQEAAARKNDV
jgi:hypothetical protein